MITPRINTFSHHYRSIYGESIGKIPIDTGTLCPNREKGGCIFCRAASFTPNYLSKEDSLDNQIERGKKHILKGRFKKYFAYFQQETCTASPAEELLHAVRYLLNDANCVGLILSTRPDHVPDELLVPIAEQIRQAGKACLWELGLQTIHEQSLHLLNRNHSYTDFTDAIQRIKIFPEFEVGAHLIFGIPGESNAMMLESVQTTCNLGIDALKLHHLQVIADTELHRMYDEGNIRLFSLKQYIDFLLLALPLIPENVVIHRLWATSHPNLLIAPKWNVLAAHLSNTLQEKMAERNIRQGQQQD
ncbi:TIGR01212 family radical SAM protein [Desulfosediminicola flagellatus]|uniref:TIGR01212 family radical SAM protein n=1 Tax=Desulfosediminicola flagellatus TaxID=2569541 RepID=UPI0010AC79C1|nr:TIGR01212 family radical SAM protein [Desulfosediminicola flagellatus]